MSIGIEIDVSQLLKKLRKLETEAVDDYMIDLKKRVEDKTPVDTGELKRSWKVKDNTLFNMKSYSGFVEYGTRYQRGAFMMTLGVLESEPDWINAVKKVWK